MEALESRQLLSISIPIYNSDFEMPTWVQSGSSWVQQAVAPGTQALNYNNLDPRFGPPGFSKTAQGGGGIGPNGEGLYNEHNDLGVGQYFTYVNGQLPAPASGVNFFNLDSGGGTYHFMVDQQTQTTVDAGNHADINYPPMICATTAVAGETYQATVALGNPLVNAANVAFPDVELDLTLNAGTFYGPSGENSYNYATGQTNPPEPGDNVLDYSGYGTTIASAFSTGASWQIAPGTFKDLSVTWTCPPSDAGMPLDIQIYYANVGVDTCFDNIRLTDITATPAAPTNLVVAGSSSSTINVNWTDNATNVGGYQLDQSTTSDFSSGVTTVTLGSSANYYQATGLSANTTYYYRVRATNGAGISPNSTAMSATTAMTGGTPVGITVPDGNFASDAAGFYVNNASNTGGVFTSPITGTLSGWSLSAVPSTDNSGAYNFDPTAGVDSNTSSGASPWGNNAPYIGNQPASSYNDLVYFPGELYPSTHVFVDGPQTGASFTATSTQINSAANAGSLYTATIDYSNVSWATAAANPGANLSLNILANGVEVSSSHLTGLAEGAPWTALSCGWICPAADAGQAIQIQLVASNFLEGPAQWDVPSIAFANATLSATTTGSTPTAPSNLAANPASGTQIDLNWTDNSNNETGFKIDQATDSGFTQNLSTVTVGANVTSYAATGLTAGTTYYYRVRATNLVGDSANTSTVSVTAPVALTITNGNFDDLIAGDGDDRNAEHQNSPYPALSNSGWFTTETDGNSSGRWNPVDSEFANTTDTLIPPATLIRGPLPAPAVGVQYGFVTPVTDGGTGSLPTVWTLNSERFCIKNPDTSTAVVIAGDSYTASMNVGRPLDTGCCDYTYDIVTEDTTSGAILQVLSSASVTQANVPLGGFYTLTTNYQAPASGSMIGQMLAVELICNNFHETNGVGSWGVFVNASMSIGTPISAPAAPSGLTATTASSSQVNLSWTDNSNNESGFAIDQSTSSDFTQNLTTLSVGANVTTYNATGLSANTTYYYRVRAVNGGGVSANTSAVNATTQNVTPLAPSSLTAIPVSTSQINLSWVDNSSNETGFKIDQATDAGFTQNFTTVTVGANVTTYSATGLSAGTTYYYRVRATNAVGDSANTATASATPGTTNPVSITVPDADFTDASNYYINNGTFGNGPTFTATMTGTLSGWTLSANPTTANGGLYNSGGWQPFGAVDAVTVGSGDTPDSNNAPWLTNQPNATSYHIFEYYPGEAYGSTNVVNGAQPGASLTMTTTGINSPIVTGTTYIAQIDYSNVSWNTIFNNSATVALNILANGVVVGTGTLAGLVQGTAWSPVTASWTATGAYAGDAIQLQVVATNFLEGGTGANSGKQWQVPTFALTHATLTGTAASQGPAAPTGLVATTASTSEIDLSWTDNSSNETGFKIDQATDSGFTQNLTTVTVGANVTTYNATGLSSNTTYYYRVRSTNGTGDSANTATASATTQGNGPAAPSGLTATAVSTSQINLSWIDNSSNETGFKIDQATDSLFSQNLTTVTVGANVTTYNATGLTSSTTYYYRVRSTNAGGDSANTSTANATTQGTAPTAPSGLTATAISSSEIDLGWTDNSNNETGFKIDQATDSGFTQNLTTVTVGANVTTYKATGLTSSTTYYYRVRATNGVGDSANTSPANATTTQNSTPVAIPVPDGDFTDTANYYINHSAAGGPTFTQPLTGTLAGWSLSASPTTANGGYYNTGGWQPYGAVDAIVTGTSATPDNNNGPWLTNQPNPTSYHEFEYYPGEVYAVNQVVTGAQPGASLTMTTTGISAAIVTGTLYTATIQYSNVSWGTVAANPSANVALNFLANGVVVGTGTLSGLAEGSPWTTVTASWTGTSAYAGQALQLQVVANHFLEGSSTGQQWQVPTFAFAHATLTGTAGITAPTAPSGLTATTASSSQINLSWTDNSNNETGFKIDQATDSGFTQNLTTVTVGANVMTYNATGLSSNTTYYYRVRATNSAGDSANTSTANATTQDVIPMAPSGLTATVVSVSQINLSWTDNSNNETGFKIDQATNSTFTTGLTTVTVGANVTTYNATGLSTGTTYYYRVRATNAVGDSANTATASAAPSSGSPITVPDGDFTDTAANIINSNTGGNLTFTSPMIGTLSGWNIVATPSTAHNGLYTGWEPYGVLDAVVSNTSASPYSSNVAWIGSQPASSYHSFVYYPGELYANGSVVGGAQPGATLTMTTTGISAAAVTGTTYSASILYGNVSWNNCIVNPSANVALNILANGIVVGTGTMSGLSQNSPWTPVTASWTATSAYAGQAIQLQVVANNFLEGPGGTQEWEVPTFAFSHAMLNAIVSTGPAWLSSNSTATWNAGTHSLVVTGPTTITADPGTDEPVITASGATAVVTINTGSTAAVNIGSVNLTNGASVVVSDTGGPQVLVVAAGASNFSIDATSKFDLGKNYLDLQNSGGNIAGIDTLLQRGFGNGTWNGTGLTSSDAHADTSYLTALGSIVNGGQFNSSNKFDGVIPGSNDILVHDTYYGNADLTGTVNGNDYTLIDAGFGNPTLKGWQNGDFNYDGFVDGSDYSLIDNAFNQQGATPLAEIAMSAAQIAPLSTTNGKSSKSVGSAMPQSAPIFASNLVAISQSVDNDLDSWQPKRPSKAVFLG
jgi:rubredoxin